MHVLLDVHDAIDDQQRAGACSIASSHEDPHEVTSISSCVDLNSQNVSLNVVSLRMDLSLEFLSTTVSSCTCPESSISTGAVRSSPPPLARLSRDTCMVGAKGRENDCDSVTTNSSRSQC